VSSVNSVGYVAHRYAGLSWWVCSLRVCCSSVVENAARLACAVNAPVLTGPTRSSVCWGLAARDFLPAAWQAIDPTKRR
jgi:hypothetical protein